MLYGTKYRRVIWFIFVVLVCCFLALDLGVFNKEQHVIHAREAFKWTALWATVGVGFAGFIYFGYRGGWFGLGSEVGLPATGREAVIEYLSGYLVEMSLSLDNVFVIALIFTFFGIDKKYQHRVLFWGIIGAIVFRGIMIGVGSILLERFEWITYVFGAILAYSAYRMWRSGGEEVNPEDNPAVRVFRKVFPVTEQHHDDRFLIQQGGRRVATPALVALVVIETTDVVFAFDSIPAIFAITSDPFIVFSSNIFAILGLRSLYFVLASMMDRFHLLKYALVIVLAFVSVKILLVHYVHIPPLLSLGVIVLVLGGGIALSMLRHPTSLEEIEETPASPEHAKLT